ncbi:Transcriptional regulatory protein [uncultured Pleomorphomonas sp.]|uniref:Crp/Fnr family transcriptional regulator n=2 Tax=Pleomorphomonas TaxID=261933 RepID=A0A2G9X0N1_9HYPH|nr:Crp/Fnr family transcriptional regulator [Pleomorphomonas carboxyditropha]PIP00532.1 Crp/Fnr family transcriptional regulator [Pleomorphomonas carboxyditropha]SCM71983.1 Transcriptional regulatory protein [uncultured Pleomorphomonas sp.]
MAAITTSEGKTGNNLIDALRPRERELLVSRLQTWSGAVGRTIQTPGSPVEWAYFPIGKAMASYRITFSDGREVETALIGREGAVGGIVSRGHLPAFALAVVLFGGTFARISLSELEALKAKEPAIESLFNRYADCLLAQVFQASACNASHTLQQRAARWLVAACERTGSDELTLTQEQLAGMLGVGRSYTTRVLGRFKAEGVVDMRRGHLTVLDHDSLAAMSCYCNDVIRSHFNTVLKGVYPETEPENGKAYGLTTAP